MRVLVTGAAGFIGFHTSRRLLDAGHQVLGYDSLNDYYDPRFKEIRLKVLRDYTSFSFCQGLLENNALLTEKWRGFAPTHVIHLAAQAGVRYSIENPMAYINSNLVGFQNVVELVRHCKPEHFVYASSSSVYGGNKELPFCETQDVSNPISLYAATKLSNELVAKSYANLFAMPSTGLRFFTVYGPYGRPDMAMFKFAEAMRLGRKLPVFNSGNMARDFTFVDDIVSGILGALGRPEIGQIYNLGRGKREILLDMIKILEKELGLKAELEMLPMQAGDVEETTADITRARKNIGYDPKINIDVGIHHFAEWYQRIVAEGLN
jgi:UDP-glucuronate 4-epimerase